MQAAKTGVREGRSRSHRAGEWKRGDGGLIPPAVPPNPAMQPTGHPGGPRAAPGAHLGAPRLIAKAFGGGWGGPSEPPMTTVACFLGVRVIRRGAVECTDH